MNVERVNVERVNVESVNTENAPVASVIIPAYNEASVIGRCLEALLEQRPAVDAGVTSAEAPARRPIEIVVAANGCTDATADVARGFPGVTVLDIPEGSKHGALNAGDAAATVFPRIYLDADIVLGPGTLDHLIDALSVPDPRVAAPAILFDTDGSDRWVRAFYDVFARLPYVRSGLVGLGVYGVSATGHDRFGHFPAIQADDLFIQRMFTPAERVITAGTFTVTAPRDLVNLVRVRTRVAHGSAELTSAAADGTGFAGSAPVDGPGPVDADAFASSTDETMRALAGLVRRRPRLLPAAVVYVGVTAVARLRAARGSGKAWQRDDSTRNQLAA